MVLRGLTPAQVSDIVWSDKFEEYKDEFEQRDEWEKYNLEEFDNNN